MNRDTITLIATAAVLALLFSLSLSPELKLSENLGQKKYVPRRLVVKFSGTDGFYAGGGERHTGVRGIAPDFFDNQVPVTAQLKKDYRSDVLSVRPHAGTGYYILETVDGCDIEALSEKLRRESYIADASPDYYAVICAEAPNDPYFQYQYALENIGQVFAPETLSSGTTGSDINALDGWDYSRGEGIVIAILDSGAALGHEDLVHKLVPGYNFVSGNHLPYDDHGHGTFVASIAGAETNNSVGIAGVAPLARIMPIKVMASDGFGSYLAIADGIRYAVDNGAHIINLSLGGPNPSIFLEDACAYAFNKGAVIVAAAGNNGSTVLYPAAYDDYCLAVAATDANDQRPSWSNHGPAVDVTAPGASVWGAKYDPGDPQKLNDYGRDNGTSFSTPMVSGAAALLLAYKPYLTNVQIMSLIKYTADDVNRETYPGIDDLTGYGRLNLGKLLGPYPLNR